MSKKIGELNLILKPSKIEGIGVFANANLKKGERLYWDKKIRKFSKEKVKKNRKLFEMCERYCVETKKEYLCPLNFQHMSVIWFLNHSTKPNLSKDKTFWITNKNIKKGEELTIDYETLDKEISNANYLNKRLK